MSLYAPLDVRVVTPRLELVGASDEMLGLLAPLVRDGGAMADPPPWDDPCSFYDEDPDRRVEGWLRGVWRGRGTVTAERWRLYFAVVVDGEPVGEQDLIGHDFGTFGTVETSSWLAPSARGQGVGVEMRAAILHLAFVGLGAAEARSEAAIDNVASNGVSERLGYVRDGTSWATHQGKPVLGQQWRLVRDAWEANRRQDIELSGVEACRTALGVEPRPSRD